MGSVFFSRLHRLLGPSRRYTLCISFTVQALLTGAAAAIVTAGGIPDPNCEFIGNHDELSWRVLIPIALVAFQSCGQAVVSRALKYGSLTSVVLTSIYCDLFSDAELFARRNVERNRRAAAPLCLLIGAILGGKFAIDQGWMGVAGVIWAAAGLKAAVVAAWLFWPAETCDNEC